MKRTHVHLLCLWIVFLWLGLEDEAKSESVDKTVQLASPTPSETEVGSHSSLKWSWKKRNWIIGKLLHKWHPNHFYLQYSNKWSKSERYVYDAVFFVFAYADNKLYWKHGKGKSGWKDAGNLRPIILIKIYLFTCALNKTSETWQRSRDGP